MDKTSKFILIFVALACLFVIWYMFYSNQNISIPLITSSSNNNYQAFKAYISNATGIPIKNITNMTSFSTMQDVIERDSIYSTKYPYQNTYVYPSTSFNLTFSNNALLFNITNNSIADIIFVVVTKQEFQNINFTNLSYQESLPRLTIPYYISRNGLIYNFKIYNPNNYPSNITIQELPNNLLYLSTLGIIYNNNFHIILYR